MIDYHLHTAFSKDCETKLIDVCKKAQEVGLKYIAITDHIDVYHNPKQIIWNIDDVHSPNGYIKSIKKMQNLFPDIDITFGLETGYTASGYDIVVQKVNDINPDFIIGSVHFIDGQDLYYKDYYKGKTKKQAYTRYLEHVLESIKPLSKYAHILGHIGYISKGFELPYEDVSMKYDDYSYIIDDILKNVIDNNMGIEINTSGLLSRAKVTLPDFDVICKYKQLGGEILTIGSDAHIEQNVGSNIDIALKLAKAAGFKFISIFKDGKPKFIKI